jgi:hypothetical protein
MNHCVAFITGHSVRGCTGLSREQREFQIRSGVPMENWIPYNFPWIETSPFPERLSLMSASWNNVQHYMASRRPEFIEKHRAEVVAKFSIHDAVILLAGSCGLELLNNLDLPVHTRQRLHVFAYGPVSRRRPEVASCFMVQGERDLLSWAFHRKVDECFPCSHIGYLATANTMRQFKAFYLRILQP